MLRREFLKGWAAAMGAPLLWGSLLKLADAAVMAIEPEAVTNLIVQIRNFPENPLDDYAPPVPWMMDALRKE